MNESYRIIDCFQFASTNSKRLFDKLRRWDVHQKRKRCLFLVPHSKPNHTPARTPRERMFPLCVGVRTRLCVCVFVCIRESLVAKRCEFSGGPAESKWRRSCVNILMAVMSNKAHWPNIQKAITPPCKKRTSCMFRELLHLHRYYTMCVCELARPHWGEMSSSGSLCAALCKWLHIRSCDHTVLSADFICCVHTLHTSLRTMVICRHVVPTGTYNIFHLIIISLYVELNVLNVLRKFQTNFQDFTNWKMGLHELVERE